MRGRTPMKVCWGAAVAAVVLVAGCGGTSAPGNPTVTPGEPAPVTPGVPEPPRGSDSPPPGALGSPIEYDSTQVGSGDRLAGDVRESLQGQLDEATRGLGCPRPRCGITVVIDGRATACAKRLTPAKEVRRGGVITVHTGPCPDTREPAPPAESTSDSPSETP
ncbi:hypothetical protein ACIRSS_07125 [Amycolatopsis sp. NPDC101161]|uniref:hypothetical protein n=1 Tax=Amycolatopsis sp. NPDC101161 TaxID=3363940 RepID=UPI00380B043B